jgi:hypothetical protein
MAVRSRCVCAAVPQWSEGKDGVADLCVREEKELISTCSFSFPKDAKRILLVLLPGEEEGGLVQVDRC